MPRKLTRDEFIERARKKHGDKYGYSKVVYVNSSTKVEIICPEHGSFWQTPGSHMRGRGCQKCVGNIKRDLNTFIMLAREVHGNKYDYSKAKYINTNTKLEIICSEHGCFWQKPSKHLSGQDCRKCMPKKLRKAFSLGRDEFIRRAKEIHGDKYQYHKVKYVNAHYKIEIVCKEHGSFWQEPNSHLQGNGCYRCAYCNKSKMSERWLKTFDNPKIEAEIIINCSNGNRYIVDGFCADENTIYEFYGDYWHGNPEVYDAKDMNIRLGVTYGELYNKTINRYNDLVSDEYNVIYQWETDHIIGE